MTSSMLTFVKDHLPLNWEEANYTSSYLLFTLDRYSHEYQQIEEYFQGTYIERIERVQNPYQYGRYMLRREMLNTCYEEFAFHIIHRDDLNTALQFNCDSRRYDRISSSQKQRQHPQLYQSFLSILKNNMSPITDYIVLVLKTSTTSVETQADYYIQYVVKF